MTAATLDAAFIARVLGPRLRALEGSATTTFTRAVVDSREVRRGDLFVALPGEQTDGHAYAAAAVRAGAAGCLLARTVEGTGGAANFVVDDTLAALQDLGAAWRAMLPVRVVGVTGSVGKTTTKWITAAVLASRYRVQANPLNYNNEVSVPLCLLELQPETERTVIEMGMYTTGEIALLCQWARPHTGVVLNVGPVHLERAGSIETIVAAKRELPEALPHDGVAVLNADDERVRSMAPHTRASVMWFGTTPDVDVRGSDLTSHGLDGFECTVTHAGASRRVRVPLAGAHLLSNALAAAAVGLADGMTLDEVCDALTKLDVPSRIRILTLRDDIRVFDDTYNAQPASMRAALDLIAETPGRHLVLLGDMRELGTASAAEHRDAGAYAGQVAALVFTIGDEARLLGEAAAAAGATARHCATREDATSALLAELQPGDVVLIKGSHALGLEHVVAALEATLGRPAGGAA
ncbi:MAG: UDP-N-acetylmuramoyl-tripeptide--D-alanyl-D-alanine ligase [Dehalococcoidia bacterium]|nr:MAG: UDP-N-acetylmuramoyl-tripeptide--D-alanyl-D-alanine ligase [Dehalococcoidia bacterium]